MAPETQKTCATQLSIYGSVWTNDRCSGILRRFPTPDFSTKNRALWPPRPPPATIKQKDESCQSRIRDHKKSDPRNRTGATFKPPNASGMAGIVRVIPKLVRTRSWGPKRRLPGPFGPSGAPWAPWAPTTPPALSRKGSVETFPINEVRSTSGAVRRRVRTL